MAEKKQITIYGKTYNIKADLSKVDPQDLADYVDEKMHELSGGRTKPSMVDLAILTALNIAGELFELKESLEQEKAQNKTNQKEEDQKARDLVLLVEKELNQIKSSRGAVQ